MGAEAKKVLHDGLALPEAERRDVAQALFDSLAQTPDHQDEIHPDWRDEVIRRVNRVRSGETTTESWSQVRQQMRLARARAASPTRDG